MLAWERSKSAETAQKVVDLYLELEDLYDKHGDSSAVRPTIEVANSVLRLLGEVRSPSGWDKRAWSIVNRLEENRYGIQTTPRTYHWLIRVLARSRERGACDSVRRFPPKQPPAPQGMTTESFNIVLTAWVRSFCVVLCLGAPFCFLKYSHSFFSACLSLQLTPTGQERVSLRSRTR